MGGKEVGIARKPGLRERITFSRFELNLRFKPKGPDYKAGLRT